MNECTILNGEPSYTIERLILHN